MARPSTRRRFLQYSAASTLATVAGCVSSASSDDHTPTDAQAAATSSETPTPTDDPSTATPPESVEDWLADANGYDGGDVPRHAPNARPRIAVGEPTDDGLAFDPPVVEVAPLTTVTWDWTGHGGQHNVVALGGTFDSGRTNAQAGTAYEYFFEETGTYPFVSEPHREDGMKGAVLVREPPSTGYPDVDEWVVQTSNFDGTVADATGSNTATVTVGATGNGGEFAFDPPVLKVSPGTTVAWEWTGNGGAHNVVFRDADISSGEVVPEPGVNFEHTFESAGTYLYNCEPHYALAMRGAVVVE